MTEISKATRVVVVLGAALALCARDPSLADASLADALYLDTETTGLSGGAGTYVFLVGLGSFTPAGFEVWQGFLADPAHERALLAEVAERIARAPLLVTFFGKSFDRHRLEDKMRMHGVTPPFTGKPHLDLYHPLRRLHGASLPDARLRTMEHALCGVERADDLPGSFAPAAWFDFLAGRAHLLEGVFAHNADDVLSLVTLGVADLERAVAFYRDGLGFSTRGIIGTEFENGAVAFFDLDGGLKLALWPRKSLAADTGLPMGPSSALELSLAHNVASREEVDAALREAEAAGARVVKPAQPTFYGGYAGYFQDPDGHLWEVAFNPGFESLG